MEKTKRLREKINKKEQRLEELLENAIYFPGDLEEYENYVGYKCEIIDTNYNSKIIEFERIPSTISRGITFDSDINIIEGFNPKINYQRLEALIYYRSYEGTFLSSSKYSSGMPVRKKIRR